MDIHSKVVSIIGKEPKSYTQRGNTYHFDFINLTSDKIYAVIRDEYLMIVNCCNDSVYIDDGMHYFWITPSALSHMCDVIIDGISINQKITNVMIHCMGRFRKIYVPPHHMPTVKRLLSKYPETVMIYTEGTKQTLEIVREVLCKYGKSVTTADIGKDAYLYNGCIAMIAHTHYNISIYATRDFVYVHFRNGSAAYYIYTTGRDFPIVYNLQLDGKITRTPPGRPSAKYNINALLQL